MLKTWYTAKYLLTLGLTATIISDETDDTNVRMYVYFDAYVAPMYVHAYDIVIVFSS